MTEVSQNPEAFESLQSNSVFFFADFFDMQIHPIFAGYKGTGDHRRTNTKTHHLTSPTNGCFQKYGYPKMDGENDGKPY